MDSDSVMHARSERLVTCLEDFANGDIDKETVELLLDAEEATTDIGPITKQFYASLHAMKRKIERERS